MVPTKSSRRFRVWIAILVTVFRRLQVACKRGAYLAATRVRKTNTDRWLAVCLGLYIASCYCLIVFGQLCVSANGYAIAEHYRKTAKNWDEAVKYDPSTDLYKCGDLEFSSRYPSILLLSLPAVLLFAYVLVVTSRFSRKGLSGPVRGFLVFLGFGTICWLAMFWANDMQGLDSDSRVNILMLPIPFFAALFWFLDLFVDPQWFDIRLSGVENDLPRLKVLYDFNRDTITIVIAVFVALSVTLVWQVSSSIKAPYTTAGVNRPIVLWIFALDVWGSVGLVGGICGEIGRRFASIIDAIAKMPKEQCSYEKVSEHTP